MDSTETDALDRADMERLQAGQDAALNTLMERHSSRIFQFLHRMLANEDDAHDLAQETFVRVFRSSSSYRPDQRFTSWLYTIAGNLARNHYRWRSRHPTLSLDATQEDTDQSLGERLPASGSSPGEQAVVTERHEAVRRAIQGLPEDLREAIVLCEWEDLPLAEAATILSTSRKAVESRLYRARNLLRERLQKWL